MLEVSPHIIANPKSLEQWDEKDIMSCAAKIDAGKCKFYIPPDIKQIAQAHSNGTQENLLLESYKIGFLYETLRRIFPLAKQKQIFYRIRYEFQVYATSRKMEMRITNYRRDKTIQDVLASDQ